MKTTTIRAVLFLLCAGSAAAIFAQTRLRIPEKLDGDTRIAVPAERTKHSDEDIKLLPKPPGKKKRSGNKSGARRRKPASEYKFERIDNMPAYKFDRKTNPIIKGGRRVKRAASKAVKKKGPALKPSQVRNNPQSTAGETGDIPESGSGTGDSGGKLQFLFEDDPQDRPEE